MRNPHSPHFLQAYHVKPHKTQFWQSDSNSDPGRRHLPKCYVIATTPGLKLLTIKVEIQTTDTAEIKSGPALVNCRATSQFIDQDYVEHNWLSTWKLQCAIPVFNVDGTCNKAGSITEIVDTILWYDGHMECMSFTVTNLRKQDIILGFTWLQEHNLEIDWWTQKVVMSWCPDKCHTCRMDVQKQQQEQWKVDHLVQVCHSSPLIHCFQRKIQKNQKNQKNQTPMIRTLRLSLSTLLIQPLEQSYPSRPPQRMVENGTLLPSSPRVSAQLSRTMRSMTRICWPLSEH